MKGLGDLSGLIIRHLLNNEHATLECGGPARFQGGARSSRSEIKWNYADQMSDNRRVR